MRCGLLLIALALFAGCGAGREQRVAASAPMPVTVASFDKSLTGSCRHPIVLVQGERIDMERLQLALDGFETTSTSSLLVASMDAARPAMALHGQELIACALALSRLPGRRQAVRAPARGRRAPSTFSKRLPVAACPRHLPVWVAEHMKRPTTVSPSATNSTISIRMPGNDARTGATQRRQLRAINGVHSSSSTSRRGSFITSSTSRRTNAVSWRSARTAVIGADLVFEARPV
jgi:hypothetical protein